jgi:hypothetical protein
MGRCKQNTKTEGLWSEEERQLHIFILELKAAFLTLLSLTGSVTHKHIRLYLDNTMAISYITNFGGRIATLHKLAQKLWFWCIDQNIWISAAHVPGECNVEVDKLSRKLNDDMEWALKPELFQKLENLLGEFDIDLFASRLNNKKSAYVSFNPDGRRPTCNGNRCIFFQMD